MQMKNKKGGAFALGMVIIVVFLTIFILHSFTVANRKIEVGVDKLENLTDIYESADRLSLYMQEAVKLSAYQTFYNITKESAININNRNCFTKKYQDENIVLWSEQCKPEQGFIEEKFFSEHDKNLNNSLNSYPEEIDITTSYTIENNKVATMIKTTLSKKQAASYTAYNLSYELNKEFIVDLAEEQIYLDDFPKIYDKIKLKIEECKEQTDFETCLKTLSFQRWNIKTTILDTWVLFKLKTKKYFFFEDENGAEQFEQIELTFGLMK